MKSKTVKTVICLAMVLLMSLSSTIGATTAYAEGSTSIPSASASDASEDSSSEDSPAEEVLPEEPVEQEPSEDIPPEPEVPKGAESLEEEDSVAADGPAASPSGLDSPSIGPMSVGTDDELRALMDAKASITGGTNPDGSLNFDVPLEVTVSLNVPVMGDGGAAYFEHGDRITLPLSDHFYFSPTPTGRTELQDSNGKLVGHVTLRNSGDGSLSNPYKAEAYIEFDGDEDVFAGSYGGVKVEFDTALKHNGESVDEGDGNTWAKFLDKKVRILLPGDIITVGVVKSHASSDFDAGTITWAVDITATDGNGDPVDLGGYVFQDDLTGVGEFVSGYVDGSPPITLASPGTDNVVSYTFEGGATSPQKIFITTKISEAILANGGEVTNQATVQKGEDVVSSNEAKATISPPIFTKAGEVGNEGSSGHYDPTNRTITWYIYVDTNGRPLNNLKIIDEVPTGLTFDSAEWMVYGGSGDTTDPANYVSASTPLTWDTVNPPTDGKTYAIGNFAGQYGLLKIVTKVPAPAEGDISVNIKEYKNKASVTWGEEGTPSEGSGSTNTIGVGVGYETISKTAGTVTPGSTQIPWTITVDLQGQSATDLVVYDLIIHQAEPSSADKAAVEAEILTALRAISGLETIILGSNGLVPNYGQKLVGTAADTGTSTFLTVQFIALYDADNNPIGTLVATTDLRNDVDNIIKFTTEVTDPDLIAGNSPTDKANVFNKTTLHKGLKRLGDATGNAILPNQVLSKEMLHRDQVGNDHDSPSSFNPNNSTINASLGYHYGYNEVIFRLNVNAAGVDFSTSDFGVVTVTDMLPDGWEFAPFDGNAMFLIYEGDSLRTNTPPTTSPYPPNGSIEIASPYNALSPGSIPGAFSADVGDANTRQAIFTFSHLGKNSYVILVKARPTSDKLDEYLVGENTRLETNTLGMSAGDNWTLEKPVTQQVRINSQVLNKTVNIIAASGVAEWTVDYKPMGEVPAEGLTDTLPQGIDLRTNAQGELDWGSPGALNIMVWPLTAKPDGTYAVGTAMDLSEMQQWISYDPDTRKLTFMFPTDPTNDVIRQGYRLTYVTDITGAPGAIENNVALIGRDEAGAGTNQGFLITASHGRATMNRVGYFTVRKTGSDGSTALASVQFTLYNTTAAGTKGSMRAIKETDGTGEVSFMALATGTYILEETLHLPGYVPNTKVYTVVVAADKSVTIDGESAPLHVINYKENENVGALSLSKIVGGASGDTDQLFTFTVNLTKPDGTADTASYSYTGPGATDTGTITSGGTIQLKHGQSVTIQDLPAGTSYTVTENEANQNGYITVPEGNTGVIERDVTSAVSFTNTRNPGQLNILKLVDGNAGDQSRAFTFTVNFTLPGGGVDSNPYPYTGVNISDGTISSGNPITLSHGQAITIYDVPSGTGFTITELEANQDGYVTTVERDSGTIVAGTTIAQTAVFTNTKNLGQLNIQKLVAGNAGDQDKPFTFTVNFTLPGGGTAITPYPYIGAGGVENGSINSGDTIQLKHGQSITIQDLPIGTVFTVSEVEANKDGYVTTVSGNSGTITLDNLNPAVVFTNTKDTIPPDPPKGDNPPNGDTPSAEVQQSTLPKTGDSVNIGALALGIVSIVLFATLLSIHFYQRRKRKKDTQ